MFLKRVCQAFTDNNVDYAIVGGYAVALHGAVRGTVDVDAVLTWKKENLLNAEAALKSLGLQSRHPLNAELVFNHRERYISDRNLIAWSFWNPNNPAEQVDLIIDHDLSDMNTTESQLGESSIKVLAKADLIAMKERSGREQDFQDIEALRSIK